MGRLDTLLAELSRAAPTLDEEPDLAAMWRSLERDRVFSLRGQGVGIGVLVLGESPVLAGRPSRGVARLVHLR